VTDVRSLAARYYSRPEVAILEKYPDEVARVRFIELWTLKEAIGKALGIGLSLPLNATTFVLSDDGTIAFTPPPAIATGLWDFTIIAPTPGTRIAAAVRRRDGTRTHFDVRPMTDSLHTHGE